MSTGRTFRWLMLPLLMSVWVQGALAHITPPVILISDREAVLGILAGAKRFFVREMRLSTEDRELIQKEWGWRPEEDFYQFYLGRDEKGELVAATIFLTEFTIHGPIRVAVGVGPNGKVKDATVVELTEETVPWVKPFLDHGLTRDYIGRGSRASFALGERFGKGHMESMPHFYAQLVASLIQRGAILYEVMFLKQEGAA